MGRLYAVPWEGIAVSASQDLWEISPADDEPVQIHAIYLGQVSDLGDAEEEAVAIKIIRGHTTVGSGGTNVTPTPLDPKVGAASATVDRNHTTIASAGSPVDLHADVFYTRVGLVYVPTPEARPKADQGDTTLLVRLMDAPADALTMAGTLVYEEG